ncbi:hypothetical protein Tco_0066981 [Tanacetum coccineum]
MNKRKKHFARVRAEEQRRKPPTKAQKRNQMCTYLKNMVGFTHSQLKNKRFDEVQKAFDKTMGWIYSFISMDSEVVKGGKEKVEGGVTRAEESSSKRAAKHGNTRPEDAYERVLWRDLKVMFEPDVEKKKYPFTPATITKMLNKKLQTDHWNEICYQLLRLMTKQLKNPESV